MGAIISPRPDIGKLAIGELYNTPLARQRTPITRTVILELCETLFSPSGD